MTLQELFQDNSPFAEFLERQCKQRAALMAYMKSTLTQDNDELTIRNVKISIANLFNNLIDQDNMVGDDIDKDVMESLVDFVKQEELLEEFK